MNCVSCFLYFKKILSQKFYHMLFARIARMIDKDSGLVNFIRG